MFRSVGSDSNGLELWIRLRGSNRCENLHQKMKSAIGYWNVGAEIGHYILVLLSYRYNVSAGIKRSGDTNFGHPYLHIIDRIQIRMQQIYDVLVYENYLNLSLQLSNESFTSVGIEELHCPEMYVAKGKTDSRMMHRDVLFMAKKMKLVMSPLSLSHPHEIKIFNDFMKDHHVLNQNNLHKLAIEFKDKSNGVTMFPKHHHL